MEGGDDTIGESLPQPVKCNNSLTTKFCWKRGEELISESDEDPVNLMSKLSGIKFNLKYMLLSLSILFIKSIYFLFIEM